MTRRAARHAGRAAGLALLALALPGCGAIADVTGAAAGIAAGTASANPAVGYAVGLGVRAATDEVVRVVVRRRQRAEQDEVAAAIGAAGLGETRRWRVEHDIPIGNGGGEVRVLRVITTPLAACKEAAFSVEEEENGATQRSWFVTTACEQNGTWTWAAAEPAVTRWGNLQ
ncbi:hypothetical protein [Roseomonas sp. BN140053]|uniref:hypothetical protein n=1 Tax=Roseomonas sp. BN140053 TaxID=3391898 RepID=UPI0039EC622D